MSWWFEKACNLPKPHSQIHSVSGEAGLFKHVRTYSDKELMQVDGHTHTHIHAPRVFCFVTFCPHGVVNTQIISKAVHKHAASIFHTHTEWTETSAQNGFLRYTCRHAFVFSEHACVLLTLYLF